MFHLYVVIIGPKNLLDKKLALNQIRVPLRTTKNQKQKNIDRIPFNNTDETQAAVVV